MIALRFYGSGSQLQVVGDTMGYDKSTVSRVVRDVTDALVDRKDQYIKWPTESQNNINKRAFYEKAGFPNVIGCIDGTHVHIQAPTEDEPAYVNRKGFHSINVQVICDPQDKNESRKACRIITACAVLHNIAILRLEPDVDGEQEEDIQPVIPAYVGRQDGQGIRDHIAINFFSLSLCLSFYSTRQGFRDVFTLNPL
ncbi:HARBI1 [Mytilus edulis]|uniref:Putative nuclease HARBI1 n=1 Tax=Mytilus edulis TaxID=6550 RepID=A0A8S3Q781_MYTED|nr:HARBI1 [Mytilus edulis]